MVFQITHEIKFNLTCEWLSNSAVHFIGIKIWPAIPCSNFFSYWLFFPSFFRNKKSTWFVVVDVKCVYGGDFPIFVSLKWKHNDKINLFDSSLTFQRLTQCLYFFFNTCWYQMCCGAKLIWQQRAFKSSVILLDFLKIKTQQITRKSTQEEWDLNPLYFVFCLVFCIIRRCRTCWFVWQEAASIKVAPVAIIGRLTFGQMNDRPLMMMRSMMKKMVMNDDGDDLEDHDARDNFDDHDVTPKLHRLQSPADLPSGKWTIGQSETNERMINQWKACKLLPINQRQMCE